MRHDKPQVNEIDISNGTCYYAANTQAKGDYIPCGNVDIGLNWACCVAGDICLGSSACYHLHFDVTYLAGCTDPNYTDITCPPKGKFEKQQWVGLENCKYDTDVWAGCAEMGDVPGSKPPAMCTCSKEVEVLTDKLVLDNVALLPTSLGGTISWYDGMSPLLTLTLPQTETPSTTTATSTSSKPPATANPISNPSAIQPSTIVWNPSQSTSSAAQVTTTPSTGTPSSNQPDLSASTPTGTNLSTAAQAGIGIGAGIGAILLGGLVYLVLFLRRRQGILKTSTRQSDLRDCPTGPTSPTATELAANELKRASELPDSPVVSELASPTSPTATQRTFRAYNPYLHGNYAQKPPGCQTRIDEEKTLNNDGSAPVSPLSPGSTGNEKGSFGVPKDESDAKKKPTTTGPIYELPG
ncbi:hypothetical protein F5B19DRAFT_493576 [Rostrohypoxylon terebratum]|nr:hypothetical protein F5B19DRAFT_493576 [Rostrohypoxylon terebratum]